jgi:diacylglycerol kinase family enzyme
VFAVGGDGTIGNVVNGLVGSETALGVLPAGTANVWSMELGLQPFAWHRPWVLRKNAAILANAPCQRVDVGLCNNVSFMMWAGIGLDAMAIQALEPRIRLDKFFAAPEYAATAIWNAAQWSGLNLHLWADEHEVEGRFILAVATNIRHYMGGLSNLSPDAYIDDGLARSLAVQREQPRRCPAPRLRPLARQPRQLECRPPHYVSQPARRRRF